MTTSVLREVSTGRLVVVCKGGFESIVAKCVSGEVTESVRDSFCKYSRKGYYILACGWKELYGITDKEVLQLRQDELEKDISFVGLALLKVH
jgi:magnesium-transporting ATPase (P-type)